MEVQNLALYKTTVESTEGVHMKISKHIFSSNLLGDKRANFFSVSHSSRLSIFQYFLSRKSEKMRETRAKFFLTLNVLSAFENAQRNSPDSFHYMPLAHFDSPPTPSEKNDKCAQVFHRSFETQDMLPRTARTPAKKGPGYWTFEEFE